MLKLLNVSSESSELPKEYRENPQFYTLEVLNCRTKESQTYVVAYSKNNL